MGESSIFLIEMLTRGCKLWNGGSDDNHNRYGIDNMYSDSFGRFTVVKAKIHSSKDIIEALKTGSFYTSTGPSIYDFYVEDDTVYVVCSPCERININGDRHQYQRAFGRHLTEFTAKLKGTEKFIRMECMDASGRSAYTNPIYL